MHFVNDLPVAFAVLGARFSKVPINFWGPKSCFMFTVFAFKIKSFNNFENDTMKLSVNEVK